MKKTSTIGAALVLSLSIFQGVTFTAKAQTNDSANSNKVTVQSTAAFNQPSSGTGASVLNSQEKQQVQVNKGVESGSQTGTATSNSGPTSTSQQASTQTSAYDQSQINNREIVVGLKKGVHTPVTLHGTTVISQEGKSTQMGYEILRVQSNQNYKDVLQKISQLKQVATASPNYLQHVSYTPSDKLIKQQWYLKAIDMYDAWNVSKGSEHPVTVAVLDTGVNANQPELAGDVLPGYNFVSNSTDTSDDNGHGTGVAGIIAANANSGNLVGVDFNAKILPIKVADSSGDLQDSTIIQGIQYAIDHGANVINMSFGGTEYDDALAAELQKAHNAGIVLVAAAGNDGTSTWEFPASNDDVISVGATDESNAPAYFSNYGDWLDLAAPGYNMAILDNPKGVTTESGTSFSTPLVSGAAALLKSLHPTWSPDQIEWALEKGTTGNSAHTWDPSEGFGTLDVYKALTLSAPTGFVPSSSKTAIALKSRVAHWRNFILPNEHDWYSFKVTGPTKVAIKFYGGDPNTDLVGDLYLNTNGQPKHLVTIDNQYAGKTETYSFTAKQSGTYNLVISDYFGHFSNKSYSVSVTTQSTSAPIASVNSGTYSHAIKVSLSAPKGDTIRYTLDGSTPSQTHGVKYSKPLTISKTQTLKVITIPASGNLLSAVRTYTYTIKLPGSTGSTGKSGSTGSTGSTGQPGSTGSTGSTGQSGSTGSTGSAGQSGSTGSTGSAGQSGSNGSTGQPGTTGSTGPTGSTGSTGQSGSTGSTGQSGSTDTTGSPNQSGAAGSTGSSSSSFGAAQSTP